MTDLSYLTNRQRISLMAFQWAVLVLATALIYAFALWLNGSWLPHWVVYAFTLAFVLKCLGDPKVTRYLWIPRRKSAHTGT